HPGLHNVIEHIFGILKHQWCILQLAPEYNLDIQAWIPMALCALHNFIQKYDPDLFDEGFLDNLLEIEQDVASEELRDGPADATERQRADSRREHIAEEMWERRAQETTTSIARCCTIM
ncbi:hypothetical protein PAXINDRAFT_80455, partial [Paxillus involutus ATCC 200175]